MSIHIYIFTQIHVHVTHISYICIGIFNPSSDRISLVKQFNCVKLSKHNMKENNKRLTCNMAMTTTTTHNHPKHNWPINSVIVHIYNANCGDFSQKTQSLIQPYAHTHTFIYVHTTHRLQ